MRVLVWFSCGAPSAVAAKLAVKKYGDQCEIIYCDTGSEHDDNKRFLLDVQKWIGKKVIVLKSDKYDNIDEVFEQTGYLVGVDGARCSGELKKELRKKYQRHDDIHILGYTIEEATIKGQDGLTRVERFEQAFFELSLEWILIDNKLSKQNCLSIIASAGIPIPAMYKMGYKNNNCIGCVKGGAGYWNKIRTDFPEVFERRAKQERKLNVAINKKHINGERIRIFLDELPTSMGNYKYEADISCDLFCQIAMQEIAKENPGD